MNALDMWFASTFDFPWSVSNSQTTSPANGAAACDEECSEQADTLDIELLSELISAQDTSSIPSASEQSQVWPHTSAAALWNAPAAAVEQAPVLNEVGLLEAGGWLKSADSQKSSQTDTLLGSLADIAALGSLTLGSPDSQPNSPPTSEGEETTPSPLTASSSIELRPLSSAAMATITELASPKRPAKVTRADSDASSCAGSEGEGNGVDSPPMKRKRKTPRKQPPKESAAYKRRREQNNQAVRRCRQKTKERNDENQRVADDLREENSLLKEKVSTLFREVRNLRALLGLGSVPAGGDAPTLGSSSISQITPAGSCQTNNQVWPGLTANLVL